MTSLILDPVAFSVAKARLLVRSNSELARRTGLSPAYLRVISGGFIPSAEVRRRIASALNVSDGDLWRIVEIDDQGVRMAR